MNKQKFKRLVESYLRDSGNLPNEDLIEQDFEMRVVRGLARSAYIPLKNELIYIPKESTRGFSNLGVFVFSDDSQIYSWKNDGGRDTRWPDTWKKTTAFAFVNTGYRWFIQPFPISKINDGKGWKIGADYNNDGVYYVFKPNIFKFMNWEGNPVEVKG